MKEETKNKVNENSEVKALRTRHKYRRRYNLVRNFGDYDPVHGRLPTFIGGQKFERGRPVKPCTWAEKRKREIEREMRRKYESNRKRAKEPEEEEEVVEEEERDWTKKEEPSPSSSTSQRQRQRYWNASFGSSGRARDSSQVDVEDFVPSARRRPSAIFGNAFVPISGMPPPSPEPQERETRQSSFQHNNGNVDDVEAKFYEEMSKRRYSCSLTMIPMKIRDDEILHFFKLRFGTKGSEPEAGGRRRGEEATRAPVVEIEVCGFPTANLAEAKRSVFANALEKLVDLDEKPGHHNRGGASSLTRDQTESNRRNGSSWDDEEDMRGYEFEATGGRTVGIQFQDQDSRIGTRRRHQENEEDEDDVLLSFVSLLRTLES